MYFLIGLICGGSFIWTGIKVAFSSGCDAVTFHIGGRIIDTTCWHGYGSVPNGFTSGWAGFLSIVAGITLIIIGLVSEAVHSW